MRAALPRTVVMLGVVSLFTDLSSEMIYPLLPVFLATVLGASALQIGFIEGVAEATASILKMVSGLWSDRVRHKKPLIVAGYSISGLFRPLIGIAVSWHMVLAIRFFDRVGKGLRSSPRDALIAEVTPVNSRGASYGFHRAMDHAGAVVGPLVASALLLIPGVELREVFLLAAVPAVITIAILVFGVKESPETSPKSADTLASNGFHPKRDWQALGGDYRRMLAAVLLFSLGNSTDAFLLVRLSQAGVPTSWVAGLWSLHNVVKMTTTYYGGRLSDRIGRKKAILGGWLLFGVTYGAFAFFTTPGPLIATFLVYGAYFGLVEPSERALVADLAPAHLRGTAFGTFHFTVGVAALPASVLFGFLWQRFSPEAAFLTGGCLALLGGLILLRVHSPARAA